MSYREADSTLKNVLGRKFHFDNERFFGFKINGYQVSFLPKANLIPVIDVRLYKIYDRNKFEI